MSSSAFTPRPNFKMSPKSPSAFPLPHSLAPLMLSNSLLFPLLRPPSLFPPLRFPLPSFFLSLSPPLLNSLFTSSDSSSSPFSSSHSINCFASIESLIGEKEQRQTQKSSAGKHYGAPCQSVAQNVPARGEQRTPTKRNGGKRGGGQSLQRVHKIFSANSADPLLPHPSETEGPVEGKRDEKRTKRKGEQQRGREVCFGLTTEEKAQIRATETNGERAEGFRCFRCGKVFSYEYYRDKHLKFTRCVDNGNRRFPCALCSRSFEKRDRLRIHILHVHERYRPHECQLCLKAFSQSSSLNKHLRTHSGERPYQCPHCEKAFTASSILRTHIRQHSGEKPFKCAVCGKCFASHAAHDSHIRRTHSE